MKKINIIIIALVITLLVFTVACKQNNYYAEVEITNIGDLILYVCVEDNCLELAPDEVSVFKIYWTDAPTLTVDLYAEIKDGNDWDETTVILSDDDYFIWETGWDLVTKKRVKSK